MTVPIRVLLAEDSEDDALLLLGELRQGGFAPAHERVDTSGDLRGSLDRGGFDLVICDWDLGDFDALDALRIVRRFDPDLPFILVSKVIGEERAVEAMRAGASDFVSKLNLARLVPAVERELREVQVRGERRAAEAALGELSGMYGLILESVGDGICGVDRDGRCTFANPVGAGMLGYETSELIGRELHGLVHHSRADGRPYPLEECPLTAVLRDGVARHVNDEVLWRGDGTWFPVDYVGTPIVRAGMVVGAVAVFRDVTERRRYEDELARARDEALESARLKSAFLANMSHEVRTPLNVILGHADLLYEMLSPSADESVASILKSIQSAGSRLLDTIVAVLDLSKLETGSMRICPDWIDVAGVVRRLVRDVEPAATAKGLSLLCQVPDRDATAVFDDYCLNQALRKILDNAVKFTSSGSVVVDLRHAVEGGLCLEVRDTGIGIDPAFLPKIGELFVQEQIGYTRPYEGVGVGLALAKRLLALNGARLSAESKKGRGSVLRVHIPPSAQVHTARAEAPPRKPATAEGKPLVLAVEDDRESQLFLRRMLGEQYDVLVAVSGEEAWRHLAAEGSRVRIVLMDLSLKGDEDGLAITRRLREKPEWREVPIIATTAHASPADRHDALAAGCSAYLAKPFSPGRLLALMGELLERHD